MEALSPTQAAPVTIGAYTLGDLLGRGGMSEVYACTHPIHGDRLALKLLRADADGAVHVEASVREVDHASVVRVIDSGVDAATGRHYLVMERLDGPDLATHLARGPLAEPAARSLFAAIADGMYAVHAHGIVHRDLKPANVMLHAGVPRIVDFGIAKVLGENAALVTSRRIGTLGYMAPEQLVGGMIAPSVDVWALGIMLFEAVTGRLPFDGFTDSYTPQLVETAPRVRSLQPVSAAYDALVARCLDGDPARRPAMQDVARALRGEASWASATEERVTQDIGALSPAASAPPPSVLAASAPAARRASRTRWIAAGLGVAGASVALALALGRSSAPDSAPSALPAPPAPAAAPAPVADRESPPPPAPSPSPSVVAPAPARPPSRPTKKHGAPRTPLRRETLD